MTIHPPEPPARTTMMQDKMSANKFEALGTSDDSDTGTEENVATHGGGAGHDATHGAGHEKKSDVQTVSAALEVPSVDHRLETSYCLWFSRKSSGGGGGGGGKSQSFDANLKLVGRFASCEQFWRLYAHLQRPGDIQSHADFHIFKEGIKPMWEDEANRFGGKWIVRLRKGLASRSWENLVLAMLGEQFMVGEEICGAVVSIRFQEDILSIWNRSAHDSSVTNRIRDTFRRVLNLPSGTVIEYKAHNDSIKDHSSFRNTDVFMR